VRSMDSKAGSNARVLVLIRQAQVVNEFLGGSRTAKAQVTERVVDYVRSGTAPSLRLILVYC